MKRNIIYMAGVALALMTTTTSFAQENETKNEVKTHSKSYKGDITVTPVEVKQSGDSLYVNLDVKINDVQVASSKSVDLTPVLVSPSKKVILPKISVKGRNNYKGYVRSQALMNQKQKAADAKNTPYAVEKGFRKRSSELTYSYTLPYELWMADAKLELQRDDCGCGKINPYDTQLLVDSVLLQEILIVKPYQITPSLTYIQPDAEEIKRRDVSAEAKLDFAVNKINIRPEYMNNPVELAKIRKMIDELKNDKNIQVKGIKIIGYASPEGSLLGNKRLSEGRAKALNNYLSSIYTFPKGIYSIEFGGENWGGLVKALGSSDYDFKNDMLTIIQNTSIEDGLEKQVMEYRGGAPYRKMLKEIFPSLRTAICKVDYTVKNFDASEAKEVIKTSPQNLSLSEMYAVANQYEKGSKEYTDVWDIAVRMFPDDDNANLNAAAAALVRNDVDRAARYLGKVKSKVRIPEYDNAMGVLEMLRGNYDKAEEYLNAAKQAGINEAQANLNELAKKLKNIEQIKKAESENNSNPNYNQ